MHAMGQLVDVKKHIRRQIDKFPVPYETTPPISQSIHATNAEPFSLLYLKSKSGIVRGSPTVEVTAESTSIG